MKKGKERKMWETVFEICAMRIVVTDIDRDVIHRTVRLRDLAIKINDLIEDGWIITGIWKNKKTSPPQ